eukprot:EG_transcript_4943
MPPAAPVVDRDDDASDEARSRAAFLAEDFTTTVAIPQAGHARFSCRKLWAFTGPGFLMSIAYLDPGNLEGDLQAGTQCGYDLLGVLFWASCLGLLLQLLSMRLGIVTGKHMAEVCRDEYPFVPRILVWLMVECAVVGSDIQEVLGSAIALAVLTRGVLPLWAGVLITLLDTFVFLMLESYGIRKLEALFSVLIATMAVTFGIEFFLAEPNAWDVTKGILAPNPFKPANRLPAIGLIGSVIMPHNLYLHSALVKSRQIDHEQPAEVRDGIRYFTIESTVAIFLSFIINTFVVGTFAASATWGSECTSAEPLGLSNAGEYLQCKYGAAALWIWGAGLLAAGQASTCTGTYAGQFIMQGFLDLHLAPWKRALLTRSIAIVPAALVSLFYHSKVDALNDALNSLQSLLLPFAILPVLYFTSRRRVMGAFVTSWGHRAFCWATTLVVLGINVAGCIQFLEDNVGANPTALVPLAIFGLYYGLLVAFLVAPHRLGRALARLWLCLRLGRREAGPGPWLEPKPDDDQPVALSSFTTESLEAADTDQLVTKPPTP